MNFSLFNQNLLLLLCAVATALGVYLFLRYKLKWYFKRLPIILAIASVIIVFTQIETGNVTDSANELPTLFWLMVAPFAISFAYLVVVYASRLLEIHPSRQKKTARVLKAEHKLRQSRPHAWAIYPAASILIVVALLFSLTQINDYYRAYPTIGSIFGQVSNPGSDQNQVIVQYNPTQGGPAPQSSIEAFLTSLNAHTNGRLFKVSIPGTISGFNARSAYVYEPAIALANSSIKLPVLILLAGVPGGPGNWISGGALEATADAFAKQHDGITPIIFSVDDTGSAINDTECVNSARGNVETYLTVDVPNYIKSHFSVLPSANNWAIGGLSMGGMCAVMLALRHPNVYHDFLDFGGEIGPEIGTKEHTLTTLFYNSISDYNAHLPYNLLKARNAPWQYRGMGGFFADGNEDQSDVTSAEKKLYNISRSDGLNTVYETVDGKHTFEVWKENFKDALPWLSNQLGATECSADCY